MEIGVLTRLEKCKKKVKARRNKLKKKKKKRSKKDFNQNNF